MDRHEWGTGRGLVKIRASTVLGRGLSKFAVETVRANPMAEVAAGVRMNVALHLLPVIAVVSDPFAIHADREQLLEESDLARVFQNPFRNPQTHADHFAVEWL
jgi:hypothetical protein